MKYFVVLNGYPTSSSKFSSETFYDVDSARNYWSSIIDEYPKSYLECYYVDFDGKLSLEYTEKDLSLYTGNGIIVPDIN